MRRYQHTQAGTLILGLIGAIALCLAVAAAFSPAVRTSFFAAIAILSGVAVLFCSLTVRVNSDWIECSFGPGLIRRRIAMNRVVDVRPVRNSWWYGWGIRLTPHGWLWNVSGLDAVELTLHGGGKFRIGTDQPEQLAAIIKSSLAS